MCVLSSTTSCSAFSFADADASLPSTLNSIASRSDLLGHLHSQPACRTTHAIPYVSFLYSESKQDQDGFFISEGKLRLAGRSTGAEPKSEMVEPAS